MRLDYIRTLKEVIYTTTLFLFGLFKFLYYLMFKFLRNFSSLNIVFLRKIIELGNAKNAFDFLKRREGKVKIIKEVVKAVVANTESGEEVIVLLL